jgi:transcriptional regulator with XRE-family HTH domain
MKLEEIVNTLFIRRRKLKMKQASLAKKLGISAMHLSHFETGRREPKITFLEKWAEKLGLKLDLLILKGSNIR